MLTQVEAYLQAGAGAASSGTIGAVLVRPCAEPGRSNGRTGPRVLAAGADRRISTEVCRTGVTVQEMMGDRSGTPRWCWRSIIAYFPWRGG